MIEIDKDELIRTSILRHLKPHIGKDNSISRTRLLSKIMNDMPRGEKKVSDRTMRVQIEVLRNTTDAGALICASAGRAGYWIASDLEDVLEGYRQERRRAITLLVTMRNRLKRAKRLFGGQGRLL